MSDSEIGGDRPVWERQQRIDDFVSTRWMDWVLRVLKWVALTYLGFGALMVVGLLLALLGVFQTTFEAGQMLGYGMASFFVGGVLLLLLSINEKLGHFLARRED